MAVALNGEYARPTLGPNNHLALLVVYTCVPTTGCVNRMRFGPKTKFEACPRGEFQPLLNSWRSPTLNVRFERSLMASWMYQAPANCRQAISVGFSTATMLDDRP